MTFQKRLKRIMKQRGWRVANLSRALKVPYTSAREWVLHGRDPANRKILEQKLSVLERRS